MDSTSMIMGERVALGGNWLLMDLQVLRRVHPTPIWLLDACKHEETAVSPMENNQQHKRQSKSFFYAGNETLNNI